MKKIIIALLTLSSVAYSQKLKTKANWQNLDLNQDGVAGMSTERAYDELLKNRKSRTVIVGIIDSGIDIKHEDIKNSIWVNTKEIPGNNIDDDKNGFIDDINGWDFLGAKNGQDIGDEQLESVRIYKNLKSKFGEKPKRRFIKKNKADYELMKKLADEIEGKKQEATQYLPMYKQMQEKFLKTEEVLTKALNKTDITLADVEAINDSEVERSVRAAKQSYLGMAKMGVSKDDLKEGLKQLNDQMEYNLNLDFDPRKLINDNLNELEYGKYGNAEVTGPDAMHGTHVAGIIGGDRINGIGLRGVADNVKILTIRCVPNGDERDKDVANAIKYAVDNGAEVINMSFGKPYGTHKKWVDDAAKYAQSKGVILVAAAGNDGENVDIKPQFPNRYTADNQEINNWISVGASSYENNETLPASFSNYGKTGVDVFAPGVAIYSSVVGSKYKELDGTSMASPAVTGLVALLKSYFPNLNPSQIKDIIKSSTYKPSKLSVRIPGNDKETKDFSELSQTGGIVNVYNAVKMAIEISPK